MKPTVSETKCFTSVKFSDFAKLYIRYISFNKSLSTYQLFVVNVSLNFHSCHDGASIIVPCPVPLNLFFEASEFDFTVKFRK